MVLSRNDKIIAALAVIILIAAAIAIILYQPAEKEITENQMLKTYSVIWNKQPGEKSITDNLYAGKKNSYNGNFSVDVPQGSVLTSVDVQVTWKDDRVYGLRKNKGLDTLTVEISMMGGASKTHKDTGSGNETLMFTVNGMPLVDSVEASDSYTADGIIKGMFIGKNTVSFDVKASVQIGEKIFRPLKYLREKGQGFNLKVTYEYCTPMIEDSGEEPPEEPPVKETSHLGIMVAMGNFGRI